MPFGIITKSALYCREHAYLHTKKQRKERLVAAALFTRLSFFSKAFSVSTACTVDPVRQIFRVFRKQKTIQPEQHCNTPFQHIYVSSRKILITKVQCEKELESKAALGSSPDLGFHLFYLAQMTGHTYLSLNRQANVKAEKENWGI